MSYQDSGRAQRRIYKDVIAKDAMEREIRSSIHFALFGVDNTLI